MSNIRRMGIFEQYASIANRFENKKIWLYGLNDDTKRALSFLSYFGSVVQGFLIEEKDKDRHGDEYLGKPVKCINESCNRLFDTVVLDVFGSNKLYLETMGICCCVLFEFKGLNFVIHGAGECGRKAIDFLKKAGGNISLVCDEDYLNKNELGGTPIVSPEEIKLIDKRCDKNVVVAINDKMIADNLCEQYEKRGFKCTYFNSVFYDCIYSKTIWMEKDDEYYPVFKPWCLKYLANKAKTNRIFLYSTNENYVDSVINRLMYLGYSFGKAVYRNQDRIIKLYEKRGELWHQLSEKNPSKIIIWVLAGDEAEAKSTVLTVNDKYEVLYSINAPLKLEREYCYDTHLGFTKYYIDRNWCSNERYTKKCLRIAIIGDSTADNDLMIEKSWPEFLVEEADKEGMAVDCMFSAVCGYTSTQELIQFERDILPYRPDIVLGYTVVNEQTLTVSGHGSTHIYQRDIYDAVKDKNSEFSFFGLKAKSFVSMGVSNEDAVKLWINNNRCINAICREFGIQYFCIIPPVLCTKRINSKLDLEMLEYVRVDEITKDFIYKIKKEAFIYDWLYDMTGILDDFKGDTFIDISHVYENINRFIAKKLLQIIKKEA